MYMCMYTCLCIHQMSQAMDSAGDLVLDAADVTKPVPEKCIDGILYTGMLACVL